MERKLQQQVTGTARVDLSVPKTFYPDPEKQPPKKEKN